MSVLVGYSDPFWKMIESRALFQYTWGRDRRQYAKKRKASVVPDDRRCIERWFSTPLLISICGVRETSLDLFWVLTIRLTLRSNPSWAIPSVDSSGYGLRGIMGSERSIWINFSLVGGYGDFDHTLKLAEINAVQLWPRSESSGFI